MKVNTFQRALVKALPNWLPCCAAVHPCAQVSFPTSPHGRGSDQEFGTRVCVAKKLMSSPFHTFLNDLLEVSQSGKRLVGVLMIITDLLQNGAKDWMFGHPILDLLARVALIQRFPYNNANCHVVTWCGPLTQTVSHMRVAVKITCLRHGHVDERCQFWTRCEAYHRRRYPSL